MPSEMTEAAASFSISDIITVVLGIYIAVMGFYMVIKGKSLGGNSSRMNRFTESSVSRFCRVSGFFDIIGGLAFVLEGLVACRVLAISVESYVFYCIAAGAIVIGLILYPILLKKKSGAELSSSSEDCTGASSGEEGNQEEYIDED